MFIQSLFKNKNYIVSKRNYLSDYAMIESNKIDMTLSGRYLNNYGNLKINIKNFDKYPSQKEIRELENQVKKDLNIDREILFGAGANGILQNLVKIFFLKKGNLVTPFYTFNQVEFAVTSFGSETYRVYTNNYKIDFSKLKKSINKKTRMIYICNPNNPTGIYEKCEDILHFVNDVNIPVIVDESSIEFTGKKSLLNYSNLPKNLFVVKSFSKAYGLANFRLGYLVCDKEFKHKYIENITINEFSGLSCIIATELLKKYKENIYQNILEIKKEKKLMIDELNKIGIECILSQSNIIMTKSHFNVNFLELLQKNGVSVVPVYDETNNLHIRIAIQDAKTNKKFINVIKRIMNCK